LALSTYPAFAGVSVIVNPSNHTALGKAEIKALFLGTTRHWSDGSAVKPVDLPLGNSIRNEFYQDLLGKSDMDMKMYWSTTIFTGAGVPPKSMSNGKEVVKFVEENPGAIGYIDSSESASGVKSVLTVQ
jgi:ABC-type phosphate transport system substrate-binding protein